MFVRVKQVRAKNASGIAVVGRHRADDDLLSRLVRCGTAGINPPQRRSDADVQGLGAPESAPARLNRFPTCSS